jgi:glycosyltransferase involved in cell wall biosynthesis
MQDLKTRPIGYSEGLRPDRGDALERTPRSASLKVVLVATVDGGNGAAIGTYRLHRGLQRLHIDSKLFVAEKRGDDPDVLAFQPPGDLGSRLRRRLRRTGITWDMGRYRHARVSGLETFSDDRSQHGADVLAQLPVGDVVHVHAMLDFIDYRVFLSYVPTHTPVVRTLRDISFFTGGCHANGECEKYTAQCGACPQLGSRDDDDLSRRIWERKRAAFDSVAPDRLHIVATSTWTAGEARRSSLLRHLPITVIPNALDTEAFCPRDRSWARAVLGIPEHARVVLFVAEPLTRRLKGFAVLARALEPLRHRPGLLFVSVGSGDPPVTVNVPYLNLGHIGQERLLSLAYSAADVFVIPSSQEAFGQTALESIACGTPVVGFAVGGIVDTVRPGATGVLVRAGDAKALGTAIADLLDDPSTRSKMAATCRRIAVEEYALEIQAQRYVELYRSLLAGPRPGGHR